MALHKHKQCAVGGRWWRQSLPIASDMVYEFGLAVAGDYFGTFVHSHAMAVAGVAGTADAVVVAGTLDVSHW